MAGNFTTAVKVEKWKLLSSHTARRSFCTNSYKRGIPIGYIMKISGHTTEKNFFKYINVSPEEHAEKFRAHWEQSEAPEPSVA